MIEQLILSLKATLGVILVARRSHTLENSSISQVRRHTSPANVLSFFLEYTATVLS